MSTSTRLFSGILSLVLAGMFIFSGLTMVTPGAWLDVHNVMKSEFARFAKVHPAVSLGYIIDPNKLRVQIGVIEILCGALLLLGPRVTKILSCLVLASTAMGALFVHYMLDDPVYKLTFFALVLLLVFVRLNLFIFCSPGKSSEAAVGSHQDDGQVADAEGKRSRQAKKQQ